MNKKLIVFLSLAIIVITAVSYSFVSADSVNQVGKIPVNSYGVNNTKEILAETVQIVNGMGVTDEETKKWYIRVLGDASLTSKNMSQKEVDEKVNDIMVTRKAWNEYAEKEYNVIVQEDELNKYISEQKIYYQDSLVDVYEGLGLTSDEFFYEFEYDNFKRNLIWLKIKPKLEDKYPITSDEDLLEYNNRLVSIYNNEVDIYIQGK